jgi:hypothetical protein
MTAPQLLEEAARRGLRLEPAGDMLAVIPKSKCSPDFADKLRRHKREILSFLEGQAVGLTTDSAPWLNVARQILDGEFDRFFDDSLRQSLKIGLRSIEHPLCRRAMERLVISEREHPAK